VRYRAICPKCKNGNLGELVRHPFTDPVVWGIEHPHGYNLVPGTGDVWTPASNEKQHGVVDGIARLPAIVQCDDGKCGAFVLVPAPDDSAPDPRFIDDVPPTTDVW
jgi:hypothetical protein